MMVPGTIVEFYYKSNITTAKYYMRIDGFFSECSSFLGGGIESNSWFIKEKKGYYHGTCGYFPWRNCESVKVCTNKRVLKKFA